ncbi:MAG TPA: DoxX family protein [Gemmatimonadales bacterium]|nr:DoxX family protein [Gemmatimonadales bacterium]
MGARLLSVLRIVAAFTYMAHGTQKLFGFPGDAVHVPYISLYGLAGVIETAGGALILVGLFTRPVAVITAAEMAVAYFLVHFKQGLWPLLNHGELAVVYCFLFIYIAAVGPGPWSLDRLLVAEGDIRSTGARRLNK